MAIHRVSHENGYADEGLELAHALSAKSAKYDASEVDMKWETFDPTLAPGIASILRLSGKSYEAVKAQFEMT
eukprot:42540-Eustigmatos_ZCMA.PRE.1